MNTYTLTNTHFSFSIEALREYYPAAHISRISPTPLLLTVADKDTICPTDLALEAYSRALEPKQLHLFNGGHFEAYSGSKFERISKVQVEFLREHLCSQ